MTRSHKSREGGTRRICPLFVCDTSSMPCFTSDAFARTISPHRSPVPSPNRIPIAHGSAISSVDDAITGSEEARRTVRGTFPNAT